MSTCRKLDTRRAARPCGARKFGTVDDACVDHVGDRREDEKALIPIFVVWGVVAVKEGYGDIRRGCWSRKGPIHI